jgi:hypothetical protein
VALVGWLCLRLLCLRSRNLLKGKGWYTPATGNQAHKSGTLQCCMRHLTMVLMVLLLKPSHPRCMLQSDKNLLLHSFKHVGYSGNHDDASFSFGMERITCERTFSNQPMRPHVEEGA